MQSGVALLDDYCIDITVFVYFKINTQNVRCARAVHNPELGATDPVYSLLFDPQVQSITEIIGFVFAENELLY